jgi:energy-coupling factor transporter transmembrane protein EcfT
MTEYNREELSNIFQILAGILLVFGISTTILSFNGSVPAFALIGSAVGLAIIVGCWVGVRHVFFMVSMILMSFVLSIYFNFGALFS